VFWHLGFWEWTGAAAVFVFLCAAVFFNAAAGGVRRQSPRRLNRAC
jgi:hypothetical protein